MHVILASNEKKQTNKQRIHSTPKCICVELDVYFLPWLLCEIETEGRVPVTAITVNHTATVAVFIVCEAKKELELILCSISTPFIQLWLCDLTISHIECFIFIGLLILFTEQNLIWITWKGNI